MKKYIILLTLLITTSVVGGQPLPPPNVPCKAVNAINNCILIYTQTEVQIDPVNPNMKLIPVAGVKIVYRITSPVTPTMTSFHIDYTGTLTTNAQGYILFEARKDALILFQMTVPAIYKQPNTFTLQTHAAGNARSITMLERK
jgi:hypothetical protein